MNGQVIKARVAVVAEIVAIGSLGGIPSASAVSAARVGEGEPTVLNWSSYLDSVGPGFQSRRWEDVDYSEVRFTGCSTSWLYPAFPESAEVELRQDRSLQPDRSWGTKTASNCFESGGSVSAGEWTGLASGNHFFQIGLINGSYDYTLSVDSVVVDTTHAD
ncbi:hypothetical protein E1265_12225 [Streptomyces sp. 8K308]|uniref:hypothetical protein n=1 Tax=Streptomyces sp. 8K308 TaxID=2530388 RepID=UPI00104C159F|nr:hypothetical protein [Streptomyces sp. 8K308]TDC23620.1 hypothetical protein E1265_12225 [Streptomyces sp. 8K308]